VSEYSGLTSLVNLSREKHKINVKGAKRNTTSELPSFGGKKQKSITSKTDKSSIKGKNKSKSIIKESKEDRKEKQPEPVAVTVGEKVPVPQEKMFNFINTFLIFIETLALLIVYIIFAFWNPDQG